ncbi:membrane protein insertase YidC [Erysipelothrix rhusiopathiae]|uniref:membrane protein insertase YidC n=1 Tax=Erysipelothrix rhusiopathiae TaxID=1648 RepID=UPI000F42EC33|nr:membrane protein insertase YidC [Erysipelothrix rhusiopathiae]AYV33823.1 membrane protein insertase YidC [Erysipelothrix rhusiopathiae]MDE8081422.1 membrane protein insertase YidC [Erysipelothrix rhusiopathiae]MDE8314072.1 membrane protein insertase YidC [Erysipelothrix rhusiopathiae]MDE8332595.1 membrane protein insertase YidC [Erysipelothrix rhusiopathiae]
MKKYKKLIIFSILLLALTGCTQVIDPQTKQVYADKIISLGDSWTWGSDTWFGALFVWPIAQALNFFSQYVGTIGSIVVVTLIIKLITIKGSIKATVQQQKMQLIGPEQARIEAKYQGRNDQQAKLQKATEMQKLFEKHEINPMGALGGTFLQLPIMIAMYQAVMRSEAIINGTVFGQTLELTPMQGFTQGNIIIIGIFILMALSQFLSMFLPQYLAKQKIRKRSYEKQPANQANMMMYSSLIMIVVLALNWQVGMSLYWMVSALAQLVQTLFINHKYGAK